MAGNISSDSVIWVVGESTGKDVYGNTATIPVSEDYTTSGNAVLDELNALEARILASGILPSVSF